MLQTRKQRDRFAIETCLVPDALGSHNASLSMHPTMQSTALLSDMVASLIETAVVSLPFAGVVPSPDALGTYRTTAMRSHRTSSW